MQPWLRNTFIVTAIVLLLMLTVSIALSQLYGGKLKSILLNELNKNLQTKVEIKGDVTISVWRNFPDASLLAENIIIHGSHPFENKKVVNAKKVYFLMNFYDLIKQNWMIKSVIIENGNMNLYKDSKGKINFQFIKQNHEEKENESFSFNINDAQLKNIDFVYNDESASTILDFWIEKCRLTGNFEKEKLAVKALTSGKAKEVSLKKENYLKNKNVELKGEIRIDTDKNHYILKTDKVQIENFIFSVNGLLAFPQKSTKIDLHILSENSSLKEVIQLLPENYTKSLREINLDGIIFSDIKINGDFDEKNNPFVNARVDLKNGSFRIKEINSNAADIAAIVMFNNGTSRNNITSSVYIEKISGKVADEQISGKVVLKNLDDPNLHIEYKGNLDLALLQPFLLNEKITSLNGILKVQNLIMKANLNQLAKLQHADDLMIQTVFDADNVIAEIDGEIFSILKGNFTANYKTISINNAELQGLNSKIFLNLRCNNWKQYLFSMSQSWVSESNQLFIDADVTADSFSWNVWQNFFSYKKSENSSHTTDNNYNRNQAANLGGKAKIKIDDVYFMDFNAKKLSAELTFTPNQIFLHNGNFNAVDGEADTKGYFAFRDRKLEINFSLIARNADIRQIFSGFNNFNQNSLTDKNIEGVLTADIKFSANWINGIFDENSLYTYADVKIENGKLLNFKPVESLSRFIDMEELREIKFGTLKNVIEIKNQSITIPKMLIASNVLSLSASGTQTFSGNINYLVKLNLFDVLGKKFGKKKQQFEFDEIDENSFNLFLNITGTINKPEVKYDRSGMKEKFKQQKEEFKQNKEGKKPYSKAQESKDWQTKEELEYIEWD